MYAAASYVGELRLAAHRHPGLSASPAFFPAEPTLKRFTGRPYQPRIRFVNLAGPGALNPPGLQATTEGYAVDECNVYQPTIAAFCIS